MACDRHVQEALNAFEPKANVSAPDLSRMRSAEKRQEALQRHHLEEMTGADLTKLPGLDLLAVQRILSEIGLDMSRWPSEKHFCAWLNVAPNNRISGGQILSSKPARMPIVRQRPCAWLRKARCKVKLPSVLLSDASNPVLGAPTAINAGAHKLARLVYRMLKFGKAYVETGQEAYEKLFKERTLRNLQRKAANLDSKLLP